MHSECSCHDFGESVCILKKKRADIVQSSVLQDNIPDLIVGFIVFKNNDFSIK